MGKYIITIKQTTGESVFDVVADAVMITYANKQNCGGEFYGCDDHNANSQTFFAAKEMVDAAKNQYPFLQKFFRFAKKKVKKDNIIPYFDFPDEVTKR